MSKTQYKDYVKFLEAYNSKEHPESGYSEQSSTTSTTTARTSSSSSSYSDYHREETLTKEKIQNNGVNMEKIRNKGQTTKKSEIFLQIKPGEPIVKQVSKAFESTNQTQPNGEKIFDDDDANMITKIIKELHNNGVDTVDSKKKSDKKMFTKKNFIKSTSSTKDGEKVETFEKYQQEELESNSVDIAKISKIFEEKPKSKFQTSNKPSTASTKASWLSQSNNQSSNNQSSNTQTKSNTASIKSAWLNSNNQSSVKPSTASTKASWFTQSSNTPSQPLNQTSSTTAPKSPPVNKVHFASTVSSKEPSATPQPSKLETAKLETAKMQTLPTIQHTFKETIKEERYAPPPAPPAPPAPSSMKSKNEVNNRFIANEQTSIIKENGPVKITNNNEMEIDKNHPMVKKLVNEAMRDMYQNYHEKANDYVNSLPRHMVKRENNLQNIINDIAAQGGLDKLSGRSNPDADKRVVVTDL